MDHLEVLRAKVGRLRVEIAQIQELNEQYRRQTEMSPVLMSLTAGGMNGCKLSSRNFPNSLALAGRFVQ
jgi:hypothetical protein